MSDDRSDVEMEIEGHYLSVARLDHVERYFFWKDDGIVPGQVVVDGDGFVISFASEVDALESIDPTTIAKHYHEPAVYELDAVDEWCRSDSQNVNCNVLLRAWNLITDLPERSDLFSLLDTRADGLYDKLFQGCNFPAMTVGEPYAPSWSTSEVLLLKKLLLLGLEELRSRFRVQRPQ